MTHPFNIVFCANQESAVIKIIDYLKEKSYTVFFADTENDLLSILNNHTIHLVVVELDFKNKDGISITNEIRNLKTIEQPYVFIFTNKADDYIQITAFNSGADDFIISPIKPALLEPRIARLKKRSLFKKNNDAENISTKNFHVDKEQYLIITDKGKIALPRKEFEMLSLMYFNSNKTFTRIDFAKHIWDSIEVAKSRTIDIHIRNIRRILGNNVIKTTKGIGYTINKEIL
jgi:two-component system alkaline phosphatase synthesis response regulator PhoP